VSSPVQPAPPERAPQAPASDGLIDALTRQARRFEPAALLQLCRRLWPSLRIRLRSKRSSAPEPSAVEAIEIDDESVVITLNIGLRSSTSPLPSYFRDLEVDPAIGPALNGLLGRLDHGLLLARLSAMDAGSSDWLIPGGRRLENRLLATARLASPSGLWWLFSRVFPELAVSIRRGVFGVTLVADDARVGSAVLGSSVLGGAAAASLPGFDVVLRITAVDTWTEDDWPAEIPRRLQRQVWPSLEYTEIFLRLWLVDPRGGNPLRLGDGRMGVEPLALASRPEIRLLFEGQVPRTRAPEG
jgi:hypothetical protein